MTASTCARRVPLGAEIALSFGSAAGFFVLVAVTIAATDSATLLVVLGLACMGVPVVLARVCGIAYAVPAAIAGLVAFDWFCFPPTHPHAFPGLTDLVALLAYLVGGVLVGELAAVSSRRADISEVARSELAEEQAALRRVATLVARDAPPPEVCAAVSEEVCRRFGTDRAGVVRYEREDVAPDGLDIAATISPIFVAGRVWGALFVHPPQTARLPTDTEARLEAFAELVGTAVSKAASREQVARLADEQAALRRVATLVARGVAPAEVFAAVAEELGRLLRVDTTHVARYEPGGTATLVGSWSVTGDHMPIGTPLALDGENVTTCVSRSGRPARVQNYRDATGPVSALGRGLGLRSSVGTPIIVEGRIWGVMIASSKKADPLPADTESRIGAFTELVATAIANTEARAEVTRLADEQAALRRVAILVASESSPAEVSAAIAEELGRLLDVDDTKMIRYDDDTAVVVAGWGAFDADVPVGTRQPLGGHNVSSLIARTGRAARIDSFADATGPLAAFVSKVGIGSAVGTPINVEGRIWGTMLALSRSTDPMPADTEARIGQFTALMATAISNIKARSDLAASRARIVAATDEERRRVVRDLHDGAQQRLVHTVITLKQADRALRNGEPSAAAFVREALAHAQRGTAELRELAHGILPDVLTRGGLRAGVDALASRMPVPVDQDVPRTRLPAAVEATAYFVVAEALTNVAKHARAERATVTARVADGVLEVLVRDDGAGGAQPDGSGLVGLADRLAVLNGRLRIESPADGGTLIAAVIPVGN